MGAIVGRGGVVILLSLCASKSLDAVRLTSPGESTDAGDNACGMHDSGPRQLILRGKGAEFVDASQEAIVAGVHGSDITCVGVGKGLKGLFFGVEIVVTAAVDSA